eukprot:9420754-Pyramimonas_sp.AAC.2
MMHSFVIVSCDNMQHMPCSPPGASPRWCAYSARALFHVDMHVVPSDVFSVQTNSSASSDGATSDGSSGRAPGGASARRR